MKKTISLSQREACDDSPTISTSRLGMIDLILQIIWQSLCRKENENKQALITISSQWFNVYVYVIWRTMMENLRCYEDENNEKENNSEACNESKVANQAE